MKNICASFGKVLRFKTYRLPIIFPDKLVANVRKQHY